MLAYFLAVCLFHPLHYVYLLHALCPQVQGFVEDNNGNKASFLIGKWDESMYCSDSDTFKVKSADQLKGASLLWEKNKPAPNPTRYNLSSFAITLNELTPGLQVWFTCDCHISVSLSDFVLIAWSFLDSGETSTY